MKAIGSFVLIRKIKEDVKTKNGLIVSEAHDLKIRYKMADVISVGSEVKDLVEGDRVYYDTAGGSDVRINGEILTVINERGVVITL